MIVSFITKSNTLLLNSSGRETHSFLSNLSNMVEVDTSALFLVWLEVFWAIAQSGFAKNKVLAKIGANIQIDRLLIESEDIIKNLP